MINDLPLVSVVMPNYNTPEKYLRVAIESILQQTYKNFEFIIVDDASDAENVDIIRSYDDPRIKLIINEQNKHVSYSLNRGLDAAVGAYIIRMDSDDISLPRRIEKQVRFLQKRPDIDVLSAQARIMGERHGVFATNLHSSMALKIATFFNCSIVNPSVVFRTSFIKENDLRYRTDLKYKAAEDYEFWSRCVSLGDIYEYPRILLEYRTHSKQVSSASSNMQIESANRVRRDMLAALGIVPNERETAIHYHFSTESTSADVTLAEYEAWAQRLLSGNAQHGAFQPRLFKRMVIQHFLILATKTLFQKRVSFSQFLKLRFTRKAFSPLYYPAYVNRYLFSKRLNRAL